ncbi:hypothetical protein BC835DRAFT_1272431 [Cytidiella melzeri]|nr:hypothetical protein BC835DRAFT_1272431 [Cytidiella melzeri]
MRFALAILALLPSAVFGTLSITGPSSQAYWVQNTSNTISWQFTTGDPSPVDIVVTNADNTTLNGPFSIAQFVNTSAETITITNVTLKVGSGYEVQFVSPSNHSQIFATSPDFAVMTPGTAPANVSTSGNSSTSSLSASGSSTGAPSPTSSGNTTSQTPPPANSGALPVLGSSGVFGTIVACGLASFAVLL